MRAWSAIAVSLFTAALAGCATAPNVTSQASAPAVRQQIAQRMTRVADWQLAHMTEGSFPLTRPYSETWNTRGWVMGAFYVGLADAADALGKPAYDQALKQIAAANGWRLGDRLTHADDHLVALIYARYAARETRPDYLTPTRESFDQILARSSQVSLEFANPHRNESVCQERWCWADALFMAPASWMAVGQVLGREDYLAFADREFWATTDYLLDRDAGFFYRDSRFFPQRGPDGEKVYWARGNGWVYAGIANILRVLKPDDPRRARYIALFRQMSDALVAVQQPDGFWRTSLAARRAEPHETSGTGFFTYGLAWGVNEGILRDPKYRRAARAGWDGLNLHVDDDGRMGHVQQVGDRPGNAQPGDMQFYGPGAYLLAGAQMMKMGGR